MVNLSGYRHKVALLIGNDEYRNPDYIDSLGGCVNDATDLGLELGKMGFTVTTVLNGCHQQMTTAIERFVDTIVVGDMVVFSFSGHGEEHEEENFLHPVDVHNVGNFQSLVNRSIGAQWVFEKILEKKPYFILFLMDCCRTYNDTYFARLKESKSRGTQASWLIAFGCNSGEQSMENVSERRNGVFTYHLLQHITKDKTIDAIMIEVAESVAENSTNGQTPHLIMNMTKRNVRLNQNNVQSKNNRVDCKNIDSRITTINWGSLNTLREDIKGGKSIRGVNLGGWLVAEKCITEGSPAWDGVPDDIANQGEFQTMRYLGHPKGDMQFKRHRDTFITEQDFHDIAAAKMNTVRIPVGYWIIGHDRSGGSDQNGWKMYAPDAINYLDQAIQQWAPRHNLMVLISIHAAKGSQNGIQNSSPSDPGNSHWGNYSENVENTLDVVEWLASRYDKDAAFLGICLLNWPSGTTREDVLKRYYQDAYKRIRAFSDCILVVTPLMPHPQPHANDWEEFMRPPEFHRIRQDWYPDEMEGYGDSTKDNQISHVENKLKNDTISWNGNWLFISTWLLPFSANSYNDNDLRRYINARIDALNAAQGGWTFWTWKFYNDDSRNAWSMKSMINRGIIQL